MEAAVSAPALANLKELVVTHAGSPSATYPWRDYDFSRLSNILVCHIPKLEVFEWSNMVWDIHPYAQPFGRMNGLKSLVSLTADAVLLREDGTDRLSFLDHLVRPQKHLPPNLRTLRVTDITVDYIWSTFDILPRSSQTTVAFMVGLINTLPISNIDIHFSLDSVWPSLAHAELPRRVRDFFPPLITALHKKGVKMTVWRNLRSRPSKILYAPSITVPFPHLADIPQDEWHRETLLLWEVKTGKK